MTWRERQIGYGAGMIFSLLASLAPAGTSFACTPTHVWDGDGPIWCAEGPRIRLAGIAAREIDGSCQPGQPCPDVTGEAARDQLVALLGGPAGFAPTGHVLVKGLRLQCRSDGSAGGNRTAAWCQLPGGSDLSCELVAAGTALRWERYWRDHQCP